MAIIEFGEYTPDAPIFGSAGSANIQNVIPQEKGYKQLNSLSSYSTALAAYCRGAFSAMDNTGNVSTYAGTAAKLYRLVSSTMTDTSKGGGYNCAVDSYWEFAKWGNKCIATNFDDNPQIITMGGSAFADLTGTPPKARHVTAVRDFVVFGNTFDGTDGSVPNRLRWSGLNDETAWTVSVTTQSDYQDLQGNGGWVQNIFGGDRGVVFQERAIWLMTYVGSPVVFQFDQVEEARGAFLSRGTIKVGSVIYYVADDGFYAFSGGQSIPIGKGKVDKTFLADLNQSYRHRVTCAAFPSDKVVVWSYPGSGSANGTPNKLLLYNWASNKWAAASFSHEMLFRAMTLGVTLDGLDALYSQLDTIPFSLDSKVWMGGNLQMAGFDTSHKLAYLTGTALDASLDTSEYQAIPGKRAEITEVVPVIDGGTHTVQMGTRETQASSVVWGSVSPENASGVCPVRSNSRYHRARVAVTGGFTDAIGVDVTKVAPAGER